MTDIKTVTKEDHRLYVEIQHETEFVLIDSFKKETLEEWLAKYPTGTRIKLDSGIRSGKARFIATWKERKCLHPQWKIISSDVSEDGTTYVVMECTNCHESVIGTDIVGDSGL